MPRDDSADRVWTLIDALGRRYAPVAFDSQTEARRYGDVNGLAMPRWMVTQAPERLFPHGMAERGVGAHYSYEPSSDPRSSLLPSLEHPNPRAGPLDGRLPSP